MELLTAAILAISFVFLTFRERDKASKAALVAADRIEATLKAELKLAWAQAEAQKTLADAQKAKLELLEESVKKTVKHQVESRALPWYPRSDREEAQMEEEMRRPSREEYQDEVAGLGR